jgi:hypothetical protein
MLLFELFFTFLMIGTVWYVNTKLDNFFKVIKFELNGTYITECAMDSNMVIPVDIVG